MEGNCRNIRLFTRDDKEAHYEAKEGKTCPTEILEVLAKYNAEGRPIWKPMHMQPIYKDNALVTRDRTIENVAEDIFERGLCLPSDINMTVEEQNRIIEIVKSCFE